MIGPGIFERGFSEFLNRCIEALERFFNLKISLPTFNFLSLKNKETLSRLLVITVMLDFRACSPKVRDLC